MKDRHSSDSWVLRDTVVAIVALLMCGTGLAGTPPVTPDPVVRENALLKVSDHVYVIPDADVPLVPNVGIIVGTRATLVVDTGLGPRNGATIMREVAKVSGNGDLYLVATHFHPEHLLGAGGFPPATKLIMASAQQQDIDESGYQLRDVFSQRSALAAELLQGAEYRKADLVFDKSTSIDLGGVHVQIMWVGPTHTRGDTVIFVEGDRVLFSGDVVMNRVFPAANAAQSSVRAWLAALDRLDALQARILVPSHHALGDASLIGLYRQYLAAVAARTRTLKMEGKSADEAAALLTTELTDRFADWQTPSRIAGAVRAAYKEE